MASHFAFNDDWSTNQHPNQSENNQNRPSSSKPTSTSFKYLSGRKPAPPTSFQTQWQPASQTNQVPSSPWNPDPQSPFKFELAHLPIPKSPRTIRVLRGASLHNSNANGFNSSSLKLNTRNANRQTPSFTNYNATDVYASNQNVTPQKSNTTNVKGSNSKAKNQQPSPSGPSLSYSNPANANASNQNTTHQNANLQGPVSNSNLSKKARKKAARIAQSLCDSNATAHNVFNHSAPSQAANPQGTPFSESNQTNVNQSKPNKKAQNTNLRVPSLSKPSATDAKTSNPNVIDPKTNPPFPKINTSDFNAPNSNTKTHKVNAPVPQPKASDVDASLDPELALLQLSPGPRISNSLGHATQNAPIFSGDVSKRLPGHFPQRSVLGSIVSQHAQNFPENALDPKLYLNVNTPFSGLICGLQGSGKSHSASVILEGCLVVDKRLGTLPKPLSGLSLHYDAGSINHPCEPAYLAMPSATEGNSKTSVVPVTVLVSPTCLQTMKKIYAPLNRVNVRPFYLSTANLNSSRMLSLMGFDASVIMPLYLQRAMSILRQMGADNFDYNVFKSQMAAEDLNEAQRCSFQMRIEMLDSYLTEKASMDVASYFKPGHLVIVDLRDPFSTSSLVTSLFEIVVGLFVERKMDTGKILLLDEAHKYLNSDDVSARFTESMLSLIRQQRHFGIRTIISTQEPTVVPTAILELVSFLILHRFTSPAWIKHLSRHISVDQNESSGQDWPGTISTLGLGEAVLVSPAALSVKSENDSIAPLSSGYLVIRTRKRLTYDGGVSIVAYNC